ncbi:MAG: PAS domain S-box protein [Acetobacteraceae bacterium]|nr:PAS domain S-box protein [Acetobacteraceae bacterium]
MDLDDRNHARYALAQTDPGNEESLFRNVVESAPYAMLLVRQDGTIALVNAEAERLFGYRREELIGEKLEMLVPASLRHGHVALRDGFMAGPLSRPMGAGRDLFGQRKDGSQIPMEVGLRPVVTAEGPSVLAAITDISVRKRADAELRQVNATLAATNHALRRANAEITQKNAEISRKNEEVESFVYIVSHDLRAPLVNLQGFSKELELCCAELETAVARLPLAAAQTQELMAIVRDDIPGTLHFIAASVGKFDRLINALLMLSRTGQQAYRADPLDVRAIAGTTLDMMRRATETAGAHIVLGALPVAWGDATAVGQVFANLIENALKYAHPERPPEIEIDGTVVGGLAQYSVRDNGIGIPRHAQTRLFQVFQRFHPERASGDGIGLAAIKRIVERLGGTIWATDAPNSGSIFRFTLPHHRPEEHPPC